MNYLTIDGMISGTGIRDTINGGYIELSEISMSAELSLKLISWLESYHSEFYGGYSDATVMRKLDKEGVTLAKQLCDELPESKVRYYSDYCQAVILTH
ncbi:hypothetical protein [Lewinella sp. 4G2]|uniref:hypothetical protein n=1 Tax=Lewinella sp. 4G2 TaxID=1803372 RepID=UPI0007B4ACDA|nr:hypothetical protein [Lewinella sp. 4G2]OAV43423.1 hypothetical protein A3850_002445 [Lewinella sp. 4G2]